MRESNFPNVPDDVLGVIAEFLIINSLLCFRQTSRRFLEVAENSLCVEDSYKKLTPINMIYPHPNDLMLILKILAHIERQKIGDELPAQNDTLRVTVLGKRGGMPPLPVRIAKPFALKIELPIRFAEPGGNRTKNLSKIVENDVLEGIKSSTRIDKIKNSAPCLFSCLNLYDIRYVCVSTVLLVLSIIAIIALHKRMNLLSSYVLPHALGLNCVGSYEFSKDNSLQTRCDETRSCSDAGIVDTLFSQINATELCKSLLCELSGPYNQYLFSYNGTKISALCADGDPFLIAYVCAIIFASIVGCSASTQILLFLKSTCFVDNEIHYESPDFREKAYCSSSICDKICAFFCRRKPTALESRLLDESEFAV